MKKIIALIVLVCTILLSTMSLSSCLPNIDGGDFGGILDGVIGGDNGSNNSGNNDGNNGGDNGGGNEEGDGTYVPDCSAGDHIDVNDDEYCDLCSKYVIVVIDFYVLNDLHGKFCDTDKQPGVDELATYLKNAEDTDDHVVLMSSGDMWQGTAESNLTEGKLITEWMNEMNFVSMTLGNHEFDWGEDAIRKNLEVAEFPFLAINVYDVSTNQLADYCTPSIMIERGDIKIGIIGAIGDCYSSVSSDMVQGVTFKVGSELTQLVMDEADRLRDMGADLIVYSLHDGYGNSTGGASNVSSSTISGYYDTDLSDGYVDLVFEAHSHKGYTLIDPNGVYHLQGGGENSGISHVEIKVNSANHDNNVNEAGVIRNSTYSALDDDPATEALEEKYSDVIDLAYTELGVVSKNYSDSEIEDFVAALYIEKGMEKWGEDYDIVLGGGFLKTRSPYDLSAGTKTYADLLSLLPFNNRLVLCSISGYNLKNRFISTTNDDYHCTLSNYGDSIVNEIINSETYYVVVDTYTAFYSRNGLTIVDYYDESTYARDLLADAIKEGRLEIRHDSYTLTSIPDALEIGENLGYNESTSEYYYVMGTVKSVVNSTYGNIYITDEDGNEIYIYGLYDTQGNRYDAMDYKPMVGDTIVVYSTILNYNAVKIELNSAIVIEINP